MRRLTRYIAMIIALVAVASCEKVYDRPDAPLIIFDTDGYPEISSFISVDVEIDDVEVVVHYDEGLGVEITASVVESLGIYADPINVTLEQGEGYFSIPLRGSTNITGTYETSVKISYDHYNIFLPFTFVVRPEVLGDISITGTPSLSGKFLQGVELSDTYVTVRYINSWGRYMGVKFSCDDDAGIDTTRREYELTDDGSSFNIEVPVEGTPLSNGETKLKMVIDFGDNAEGNREFSYDYDIDVIIPVPFVSESVSHTIITADRNTLGVPEAMLGNIGDYLEAANTSKREFTYNTVFLDLNGDGYVTDNCEIWLDRNIGATSTDIESTDSYGFIYQALRMAPGYVADSQGKSEHYYGERYSIDIARWYNYSGASINLSEWDNTGTATGVTITVEHNTNGPMNICPEGYRLPTAAEWARLQTYFKDSVYDCQHSVLNMPLAGAYTSNKAEAITTGIGYYWAAPTGLANIESFKLQLTGTMNTTGTNSRGNGLSVRCVKANPDEIVSY